MRCMELVSRHSEWLVIGKRHLFNPSIQSGPIKHNLLLIGRVISGLWSYAY